MRKILAFVLLIAVCLSCTACGDREYDEAEVSSAAVTLIEKSELLNKIFWGEGLRYREDPSTSNGAYHEADYTQLDEYGFRTVDELKKMAEAVFSVQYCDSIFTTVFSSINDDEEIQFFARYYQKYEDAEGKIPECIMVYSYADNLLPDKVEYLYDTVKVIESRRELVYVTIEAKVTRDDKEQRRTKTVALIEEANGWRIDSSTYLKYSETLDDYEDLLDKK